MDTIRDFQGHFASPSSSYSWLKNVGKVAYGVSVASSHAHKKPLGWIDLSLVCTAAPGYQRWLI
jgi:hypothetical protein